MVDRGQSVMIGGGSALTCALLVLFFVALPSSRPVAPAPLEKQTSELPLVAVVYSYDDAYPWQAQIRAGIEGALEGRARMAHHSMETLGVKTKAELEALARRARKWIAEQDPEVVVVADDNAMRLVALPEAAGADRPVVFCGVNWPAAAYDLPRPNLHGMVEISPARRVMELLNGTLEPGDQAVIIGADRPTDRAQAEGFRRDAALHGLETRSILVTDFEAWLEAFSSAQADGDLVFLLNNAGIKGWDDARALEIAREQTRAITVSEYAWMSPIVTVAATKRGEEQGAWAAAQALALVNSEGFPQGPVVVNRDVVISLNRDLMETSGRALPPIIHILAEAR